MKKLLTFLLAVLMIVPVLCACGQKNTTVVRLNEVTHSVFYAPQYVALAQGYFLDEGLEVELSNGQGADAVMAAVLSGNIDIGFAGPEASIYVYSQNPDDYIVNFAQLTQRAGNFLVAREPADDFQWADLKGKNVLGGRKGGVHTSM